MTVVMLFGGILLMLFLFASVFLGMNITQREEQQASADALAIAATTIAAREGVDAVCNHPAMQALVRSNMAKYDQWDGNAACPQVIRQDLGDGRYRLGFEAEVSGRPGSPFGQQFEDQDAILLRQGGTAEIDENQFNEIEERRPKLVLVLDYSGSMGAGFGNGTRMDSLRSAVSGLISQRLRAEYGLVMFNSGVVNAINIDADDQQRDILDAINSRGPGGGTEYGGPIARAADMLVRTENTGWYILFVTDGQPNNGAGPSLRAADQAKDRDIGIFTLFIGSGGGPRNLLIDMSGTRDDPGGPGNDRYFFQAGNDAQLQQTFRQIVSSILCSIGPLNPVPDPDFGELNVFMVERDGDEVPLTRTPNLGDNANALAYNYIRDENKIRLTQRVCDEVLDNGATITARFGSPLLVD